MHSVIASIRAGANCCFDLTALNHLMAAVINAGEVLSDQLKCFLFAHNDSALKYTRAVLPELVGRRIILWFSSTPATINGG